MVPLFKPYVPELPLLEDILHSGQLAAGKYTKRFEESVGKYLNQKLILATNSYSQAIKVMLSALGLNRGDEILMSPMACLSSAMPYLEAGMKITWCDVDPGRGTLSPESAIKSITPMTRAIVHNHFCGYPGHIDEIRELADRFGLLVIDDGFECFGSEYKGRLVGSLDSDATVFSLSAIRLPNALDGGLMVFNDESAYKKALLLRDLGVDRASFRGELGEINPQMDVKELGYSATMSNVNAYIALEQMPSIDDLLTTQRKNADYLSSILSAVKGVSSIDTSESLPNYWVYGIIADNKEELLKKLRQGGLYASGVHIDISRYSAFGTRPTLPGVQQFESSFLAVPCGWWIKNRSVYDFLRN